MPGGGGEERGGGTSVKGLVSYPRKSRNNLWALNATDFEVKYHRTDQPSPMEMNLHLLLPLMKTEL